MIYEGYEILVGKNARDNDRLVLASNNDDVWFHAKDTSGRHVVVKNKDGELPANVIYHAASLASGGKSMNVMYTRIVNVTKEKYSKHGEVLVYDYKIIHV